MFLLQHYVIWTWIEAKILLYFIIVIPELQIKLFLNNKTFIIIRIIAHILSKNKIYAINVLTFFVNIIKTAKKTMSFLKWQLSQALPEIQTWVQAAKIELVSFKLSMMIWWHGSTVHVPKLCFKHFTQKLCTWIVCVVPSVTLSQALPYID